MATELIHQSQLNWNNRVTQISVNASYDDRTFKSQPPTVEITTEFRSGDELVRFGVGVPTVGDLTLNFTTLTPHAVCLIGCGLGALIKIILQCRTLDVQRFIACLKEHGVDIGIELATCAVECFAH